MSTQIAQFLSQTRTALDAALQDDDLMAVIEPFGYDADAINGLLDHLDEAQARQLDQSREYADQYTATAKFETKEAALRQKLTRHRRLARVAIDTSDSAYGMLGLDGRLGRGYDELMQQATGFYTVLRNSEDLQTRLAALTITADAVEQALADIEAIHLAKAAQRVEMREAQVSTDRRNAVLSDLRGRMSDFLEVARIATTDRPQLRETLGIVAPS